MQECNLFKSDSLIQCVKQSGNKKKSGSPPETILNCVEDFSLQLRGQTEELFLQTKQINTFSCINKLPSFTESSISEI